MGLQLLEKRRLRGRSARNLEQRTSLSSSRSAESPRLPNVPPACAAPPVALNSAPPDFLSFPETWTPRPDPDLGPDRDPDPDPNLDLDLDLDPDPTPT